VNRFVKAILIAALVVGGAAAVLLGLFRIKSVEVSGNERYSADKISSDLIYDYWTQNTLYFLWKYKDGDAYSQAPYLSSMEVNMVSPTSVSVEVEERALCARVEYNSQYVYFDQDGMVQEITDTVYEGVPLVTGIEIEEPQLYQKLTISNTATLRTVLNISKLLIQADLIPDSVNFDESGNMTLSFGSVSVKLGQDEYLEEKIANLKQIYQEISSQSGTLNMEGFTGKNEAITFRKTGETESESETEGEESAETSSESSSAGSETLAGVGQDTAAESTSDGESGEEGTADAEASADDGADAAEDTAAEAAEESVSSFMVFDSSGTLRYDAHVVDGQVVDGSGNLIDGCSVDENGNVVDAYWNVIDPATGQLAE